MASSWTASAHEENAWLALKWELFIKQHQKNIIHFARKGINYEQQNSQAKKLLILLTCKSIYRKWQS